MKLIQLVLHGGYVGNPPRLLRPLWQIALLVPVAVLYYPARLFVDTVDKHL